MKAKHPIRLCQCCACKAKRARAARIHALTHSRITHLAVFVAVAAGMLLLERVHIADGVTLGAVAVNAVKLVGECIADRMFPPEILRG